MSNSDFKIAPSRTMVQRVTCPRCKATKGDPCMGTRGPRKSNHIQRVNAFNRIVNDAAGSA
jgi:hypothetical protein